MAVKFQYNKTSLHALGKQLKIRIGALPILKNKESALRVEVINQKQVVKTLADQLEVLKPKENQLLPLIGRFPTRLIKIENYQVSKKKIAGVTIPIFEHLEIQLDEILWHEAPHWYPDVMSFLEEKAQNLARYEISKKQLEILEQERKKTTQKVNLYEKVQIPELEDAIKKIKRFLEDEQNLSKAAQKMVKARKMEA